MSTPQPENSAPKQAATRFQKGFSGNPAGKPKGTRHKATQAALALMDGQLEAVTQTLIDAALGGDLVACKVLLDKIVPNQRERAICVSLPTVSTASDLPQMTACIMQSVACGDLTPTEGEKLAGLAVSHAKVLEIAELEARILALEQREVD